MMNNTYNNLGIGASLKLGPVQIYFITDNLSFLLRPYEHRSLNLMLGMNFLFGKRALEQKPLLKE